MPVRIGQFQPTTMERVEELRRREGRRGDPVMDGLLDAVEAGGPGTSPRGLRIAIARAPGRRGGAVEIFESQDGQGNPVVTAVKRVETPAR
jgi:hypothetical protein